MFLPATRARAASVLRDERHADRFEGGADRGSVIPRGLASSLSNRTGVRFGTPLAETS
jgi:hypothetical protein